MFSFTVPENDRYVICEECDNSSFSSSGKLYYKGSGNNFTAVAEDECNTDGCDWISLYSLVKDREYYLEVKSSQLAPSQLSAATLVNLSLSVGKHTPKVNYTYGKKSIGLFERYAYIKTKASNVTAKVINNALAATDYYGVNGTFFSESGGTPGKSDFIMPNSVGICWFDGATREGSTVLQDEHALVDYWENNLLNNNAGKIARGSFTIYETTEGYKCAVYSNSTATGIRNSTSGCKVIIGGGHLQLQNTKAIFDSTFENEKWAIDYRNQQFYRRTGLGFKVEKNSSNVNEWWVYLVVSKVSVTLYQFRDYLKNELGCHDGIFLDGASATQMQCDEDKDTGSRSGKGRVISNAVVLIDKT
jgi:hypothetical protein